MIKKKGVDEINYPFKLLLSRSITEIILKLFIYFKLL